MDLPGREGPGERLGLQWGVGVTFLFVAGLVPGLLGVIIHLLVRGDETA